MSAAHQFMAAMRAAKISRKREATKGGASDAAREANNITYHVSQRGERCGRCGETLTWKSDCRYVGGVLHHSSCAAILSNPALKAMA